MDRNKDETKKPGTAKKGKSGQVIPITFYQEMPQLDDDRPKNDTRTREEKKHAKRKKKVLLDRSHFVCYHCSATETPVWRRGPAGPKTLCNACGLQYAKIQKEAKERRGRNGERGMVENDIEFILNPTVNWDHSFGLNTNEGGATILNHHQAESRNNRGNALSADVNDLVEISSSSSSTTQTERKRKSEKDDSYIKSNKRRKEAGHSDDTQSIHERDL